MLWSEYLAVPHSFTMNYNTIISHLRDDVLLMNYDFSLNSPEALGYSLWANYLLMSEC